MTDAASGERDAIVKAGDEYTETATPITEAIKKTLGDLADAHMEFQRREAERMAAENRSTDLIMRISSLLALASGTFVAIFLSRQISGVSRSVLAQAAAIADGDLTRDDLKIRSQDELGDLTATINKMSANLKKLILAIREGAQHVASASEELSATSQQISTNSEETSAQTSTLSQAAQQVSQNLDQRFHWCRGDDRHHSVDRNECSPGGYRGLQRGSDRTGG